MPKEIKDLLWVCIFLRHSGWQDHIIIVTFVDSHTSTVLALDAFFRWAMSVGTYLGLSGGSTTLHGVGSWDGRLFTRRTMRVVTPLASLGSARRSITYPGACSMTLPRKTWKLTFGGMPVMAWSLISFAESGRPRMMVTSRHCTTLCCSRYSYICTKTYSCPHEQLTLKRSESEKKHKKHSLYILCSNTYVPKLSACKSISFQSILQYLLPMQYRSFIKGIFWHRLTSYFVEGL